MSTFDDEPTIEEYAPIEWGKQFRKVWNMRLSENVRVKDLFKGCSWTMGALVAILVAIWVWRNPALNPWDAFASNFLDHVGPWLANPATVWSLAPFWDKFTLLAVAAGVLNLQDSLHREVNARKRINYIWLAVMFVNMIALSRTGYHEWFAGHLSWWTLVVWLGYVFLFMTAVLAMPAIAKDLKFIKFRRNDYD